MFLKFVNLFKFIVKISIILPGVHIIISTPFFNYENYFYTFKPPTIAIEFIPNLFPNNFVTLCTYNANSLVGTNINPNGPSFFLNCYLINNMCFNNGNTYAIVFPLPVSAIMIESLPDNNTGNA